MTKNELRYGNLFTDNDGGWIGTVDTIHESGVNKWQDMGASGIIKFDDMKPIKLTEEWLIKLGFELKEWEEHSYRFSTVKGKGRGYVYDNVWAYIFHKDYLAFFGRRNTDERYSKDSWNFCQHGHSPRYVHELQNLLYALTQKELTIKG